MIQFSLYTKLKGDLSRVVCFVNGPCICRVKYLVMENAPNYWSLEANKFISLDFFYYNNFNDIRVIYKNV